MLTRLVTWAQAGLAEISADAIHRNLVRVHMIAPRS